MKASVFQFGPFELDRGRLELRRRGVRIRLPVSRLRLLLLLVTRRGELVTRDEIAACLWKDTQSVDIVGGINTAVNHLRSQLGDDPTSPKYIETVIGAGYRFVANIEEVATPDAAPPQPSAPPPAQEVELTSLPVAISISDSRPPARRRRRVPLVASAVVVLAGLSFYLFEVSAFHRPAAQTDVRLARVTDSGDIECADISPDGNYLTFMRADGGSRGVFLKQLSTGHLVQLASLGTNECLGLAFSPDGNFVYFAQKDREQPGGELDKVPFLGGKPTVLLAEISGPPAVSPDGRRVAFVRSTLATHGQDGVVVASLDGSGERVLASYAAPGIHLNRITWSADGKSLIYPLQLNLMSISVDDGKTRAIPGEKWAEVFDLRSLPGTSHLIVLGRPPGSTVTQIFEVSLAGGVPRQITHDLANYAEVRVTADGQTLMALEDLVLSSIQIVEPGHGTEKHPLREENQNRDGYIGVSWTPEGKIVYSSESDRRWDVMEVDGDGSESHSLTDGESHSPYSDPDVSARGDFIAVAKWTANDVANIWRMDKNGESMKRLTSGKQDDHPAVNPDGKWVVYSSVQGDQSVLMKVPSEGGPATRLTEFNADIPSISPDGKWIACFRSPQSGQPPRLVIIPFEGGPPVKTFPLPASAHLSSLGWTPDGGAVGFINEVNGVGNIWQQPLGAGPQEAVTHFTSGKIFKFRWSRNGRLALSGGEKTVDAILIRNFRESVH